MWTKGVEFLIQVEEKGVVVEMIVNGKVMQKDGDSVCSAKVDMGGGEALR